MAKMGGTGVRDTVKKWMELTVTKMGGTGVTDTVTKMGGAHCGKNGWRSPWQKWVELVLETPWQKWVELAVAKMG